MWSLGVGNAEITCLHQLVTDQPPPPPPFPSLSLPLPPAFLEHVGRACEFLFEAIGAIQNVVNRIKSAIVNFIKAAQCVVVETLLAAFGVFLDQTIQTAFPPIKAMTMTPMCVTKAAKQAEKKPPPVHPPPPSSLEKGITSGYKGITSGSARNEMLGRKPSSAEAWKAIGEAFQGVVKNPSRRSIVMFIWQLFVFIVNKIDNDSLNKFVSSAATKTIMWLVNMIWDALCGNFGTALMSTTWRS